MKYIGKKAVFIAALMLSVSVLFGATKQSPESPESKESKDFTLGRNIEMLINMFRDINIFYVDDVDANKLMSDAAEGMVKSLDPYTNYIPASDMEDFEFLTTGKYGGIGSIIRKKGDYTIIAQPYKGSPADKAGLKVGDKIIEISGEDAKNMPSQRVSTLLKGDPGSVVNIKVERFDSGEIVPFSIKREKIVISGVPYFDFVSDSIAYIQHSEFTEGCYEDLLSAFMTLKESGKLKGLILDYRSNGGGILQEAVKTLSIFLPQDTEIVSVKGRTKQTTEVFRTTNKPVDTDIPIVVLTSSGSASAAEIVAGAMQDLDRAVLIGQRTFGKGLVQTTRPIGYDSFLKITTAKYYIPSGRCIQAVDYTHRNEDGSVGAVPDSMISEFTTKGGRKVYDGGGVMPDIKIDPEYLSRFIAIIYRRGYISDFIDEYRKRNNNEEVDANEFKLSDAEYAHFIEFMSDKNVEFESESKRMLTKLIESSKREKFHDNIKEQLTTIQSQLKDDKDSSLKLYEKELRDIIEDEIVLTHHYEQGVTKRRVAKDKVVQRAVELLNDPTKYNEILLSQDTSKK